MLKKRLVGVVTVKNGWAVQSFGYGRYLPLGKPECLVENLDRWGADEILVQVIDRSTQGLGPDFDLLKQLSVMGLSTPLIYAGGIHSQSDGIQVIQLGADRFVLDTLLHTAPETVIALSEQLGSQALIASLPLTWQSEQLFWYDYHLKTSHPLSQGVLALLQTRVISEVLVIDWQNEGQANCFEPNLISAFPFKEIPLIAFGGLSETDQIREILSFSQVSAVGVGNFLNYREHAVQKMKESCLGLPLRPANYASRFLNNSDG